MNTVLLLIGISLLGMEFISGGMYLAALGAGAIFTGLAEFVTTDPGQLILVFIFATAVSALILTRLYRNSLKGKSPLIGKEGEVTEAIEKEAGKVKVEGVEWLASSRSKEKIGRKDKIVIRDIDGARLIVEKKSRK